MGRYDGYRDEYEDRDRPSRWDDDRPNRWDDDRPARRVKGSTFPTFSRVLFIIDIVLCGLRLLMVPLGLLGYMVLKQQPRTDPQLMATVLPEIVTNAALGVIGLLAAIVMLMRVKVGVALGFLTVVLTLLSLGVGVWQSTIQMGTQNISPDSPEGMGFMVGAGFMLLLRAVLLLLYVIALFLFMNMPAAPAQAESRYED